MNPYQFFLKHAGYSYVPATQSPMQGRMQNARRLAAAERKARDAGISFEWGHDDCLSSEWIADDEDGGRNCNAWQTWYCVAHGASVDINNCLTGKLPILASLGAIDFGRGGEPWGNPYRRVVEAELALEALEQLEVQS